MQICRLEQIDCMKHVLEWGGDPTLWLEYQKTLVELTPDVRSFFLSQS